MGQIVLFDPRSGGLDDLLVFAQLALHERGEAVRASSPSIRRAGSRGAPSVWLDPIALDERLVQPVRSPPAGDSPGRRCRTRCRCRSCRGRAPCRPRRSSARRASRSSAAPWSRRARFSLPALMLADAAARLSKFRSTWPASSASCAGLPAGVGNVDHEHAGLRLEHLAGEVAGAAVAARAVVELARVLLRVGRPGRRRCAMPSRARRLGVHHQHVGHLRDAA